MTTAIVGKSQFCFWSLDFRIHWTSTYDRQILKYGILKESTNRSQVLSSPTHIQNGLTKETSFVFRTAKKSVKISIITLHEEVRAKNY